MQTVKIVVLVVFFLVVCIVVTHTVLTKPVIDPAVKEAQTALYLEQLHLQRQHIRRNADLWFYGTLGLVSTLCTAALIATAAKAAATLKRARVHIYRIGAQNEIVVHEKDLSLAAPVAMGLMNAEQLRQMNGGLEKAFELYTTLADVQTRQMRGLLRLPPTSAAVPHAALSERADRSDKSDPPTFQQLLERGELADGRPMILGYENGVPRRGSFLDIYSAAVAGESGSGKTATLLFLIGSGIVAQRIRFIGIDPHYPHPKSLGFKTKPLWEAGLMQMATYKDDMLAALHAVEQTIDQRLQQVDTDTTPVVLVIDELAFLVKTSVGPAITHTMERISTEGRKCAVYMLASSQTWLAARTGNNSVVRDTLTSAYVHRIKPKQANLLLQDKDEAEKVKKQVKRAGEALLVPVGDESVVVKIPFTTDADMLAVVAKVTKVPEVPEVPEVPKVEEFFQADTPGDSLRSTPGESASQVSLDLATEYGLRLRTRELLAAGRMSYGEIGRETGISKSTAHNWIKHPQKTLKPEQKTALKAYIARLDQKIAG